MEVWLELLCVSPCFFFAVQLAETSGSFSGESLPEARAICSLGLKVFLSPDNCGAASLCTPTRQLTASKHDPASPGPALACLMGEWGPILLNLALKHLLFSNETDPFYYDLIIRLGNSSIASGSSERHLGCLTPFTNLMLTDYHLHTIWQRMEFYITTSNGSSFNCQDNNT